MSLSVCRIGAGFQVPRQRVNLDLILMFSFCFFFPPGEEEDLGPPPTVDEAADALMTRLGFLLGDKIITGEAGSSYHGQDDGQVISKRRRTRTHTHTCVFSLT